MQHIYQVFLFGVGILWEFFLPSKYWNLIFFKVFWFLGGFLGAISFINCMIFNCIEIFGTFFFWPIFFVAKMANISSSPSLPDVRVTVAWYPIYWSPTQEPLIFLLWFNPRKMAFLFRNSESIVHDLKLSLRFYKNSVI